MKRIVPIVLIWFTVATALFELLSHLQLVLISMRGFLEILVVGAFFISILIVKLQFVRDGRIILSEIEPWDSDMKTEITQFLQARKTRLITSLATVTLLLIFKFVVPFIQPQFQEVFLYIFVIGLFHMSLISSLILFKMSRTILWVQHENLLARQELA
jgi:hypothetical protein